MSISQKVRRPAGRPKKYTEQWIKRCAGKLLLYASEVEIPLECDFASRNNFSSQRLSEFAKVSPIFAEALKRFKDIQQTKIVQSGMYGRINVTMAIFTLKNVSGWRDVQPVPLDDSLAGEELDFVNMPKDKTQDRFQRFLN